MGFTKVLLIAIVICSIALSVHTACTTSGSEDRGGVCVKCDAGTYSSSSTGYVCKDCPAGKYSGTGASSCSTCSTGYFSGPKASSCSTCPPGSTNNSTFTGCDLCSIGRYNPNPGDSCDPCPAGYIQTQPGSTSCNPCIAGQSSDAARLVCSECPAGKYAPQGSACLTCSTGDYTPEPGYSSCLRCPGGYEPFANKTGCQICPIGEYAEESSTCSSCSTAEYTDTPGQAVCKQCPPGWTHNSTHTGCQPCPIGEVQVGAGYCGTCFGSKPVPYPGGFECEDCQDGWYGSPTQCIPCNDGYGSSNNYACFSCGTGRFSISGSACQNCPPGYGLTSAYPPTECVACPAGTYSSGSSGCLMCPDNTINTKVGQSSCQVCPNGQIANSKRDGCIPCPAGSYATSSGCRSCGVNAIAPNPGSSSCTSCPDGYRTNYNRTACFPCPAGTYESLNRCFSCSSANSYSDPGSTSCKSCPTGTVAKKDFSGCVPTGSNVGCARLQYFDGSACVACPLGQVKSSSGTSCVPCGGGYITNSGGCDPCDWGDLPALTSSGTSLYCKSCGLDDKVPSADYSTCATCPIGSGEYFSYCIPCVAVDQISKEGSCSRCSGLTVPNADQSACITASCNSPAVPVQLDDGIMTCLDRTQACPNGQYKNFISNKCADCPMNTYSRDNKGGGVCIACPKGTSTNGLVGQATCSPCPLGQSTTVNYQNCTVCGWGYIQDTRNQQCISCPTGYSTDETSVSCNVVCPAGTSTFLEGGNCTACAAGFYAPTPGSRCVYCPPGTTSSSDRKYCVACPVGTYSEGDGSGCRVCSGSSTVASSIGSQYCALCPTGYIANAAKTACIECTCETCPANGDTGCTNPAALNYFLTATNDDGSCQYPNSDFVKDIVSCPKTPLTVAAKTFSFTPFTGVSGMVMNSIKIGFVGFFDVTSSASVVLIAPSGKRVTLIAPGDIANTTCNVNLGFHSDPDYGEKKFNQVCTPGVFTIPCNGFFADNIYIAGLQGVLNENPGGNWVIEVKGSTGQFARAQLAITQYYQLAPNYIPVDESNYLTCSQTEKVITLGVSNSIASSLSVGKVIAGAACGSFVINITSITPNGGSTTVVGSLTGLEGVFKELRLYGAQPSVVTQKRFEAKLFEKKFKTGDIPIDDILTASATITTSMSTILDISIGFFRIKKVSILAAATVISEIKATLGWDLTEEDEIIKTIFGPVPAFRGGFLIPPGIPIPYEVQVGIDAGFALELKAALALVASGKLTQSLKFGLEWADGEITPVGKAESKFEYEIGKPEYQCSADVKIFLGPTVAIGLGKDGILYAPITVAILPYMGTQIIQSIGSNKKCCSDTSLETRQYWGVEVRLTTQINIGEKQYKIGDPVKVCSYEKDTSIQCFPSLPVCPTMDCSKIKNETVPEATGQSNPARAFGDPHFTSSDGCSFNFQGFGDYLLLESQERTDKPAFLIHGRFQGPDLNITPRSVSYVTSVAVSQDPLTSVLVFGVNIYKGADPYSLFLNNELLNLPLNCPYKFDGGVVTRTQRGRFRVDFDRGYTVEIRIVNKTMFVNAYLPIAAKGKAIGILGSYDGIKENQFTGRDDIVYGTCTQFEKTNDCNAVNLWGQTYLLTQEESLLRYATGQTTQTFYKALSGTVSSSCASIDIVDPAALAAANSACASITDPDIFNACVWDIQQTQSFDSVETSNVANSNAAYANYTISNLSITIGNSNEKIISWVAPTLPPVLETTKTYEVQYRVVTSSILTLNDEQTWTTIASNLSSTTYSFTDVFNTSLAISVRVRVSYLTVGTSSSWISIDKCIPLCSAAFCCDGCNLFPCLSCPTPKFTCVPPTLTCSAGYFDNELLNYIVNCTLCFANFYSPSITIDNQKCLSCPSGTNTNALQGSKQLTDCGCNAGSGHPANAPGPNPQCSPCAINTYSKAWNKGLVQCTSCPSGSTTNGQTGATTCGCPAGSGSVTTDTTVINCQACGLGKYTTSFNLPGVVCSVCSAGQTSNTGNTGCVNCTAGRSSSAGGGCSPCPSGQSSISGGPCVNCTAGSSSASGGLCAACPAGQSSQSGGPCVPCAAGQYSVSGGPCLSCNDGSSYFNGACNQCPAGSVSIASVPCSNCTAGKSSPLGGTVCSNCDAGQYSVSGGVCLDCKAGESSSAGSSSCTKCFAGQSSTSGGICVNCKAGQSSISGGACTNCTAGSSSTSGGACVPCADGQFSVSGGVCTDCGDGYSSISPHTECFVCNAESCLCKGGQLYNQSTKQCSNCAAGQSSSYPYDVCVNCTAGQSSSAGGVCADCPEGQFSVSGGPCTSCPSGQYPSGSICLNCTAGQSSNGGGVCTNCTSGQISVSGGLCVDCDAGLSSVSGGTNCFACKAGQYSVKGGVCLDCPSGQSSTSGAKTCTDCKAGTISVSGGPCVNCGAGESSLSGEDTCFKCNAGQSSTAGGLCINCDAGTISTSGGPCTPCDAGSSSSSGSVQCFACRAGETSVKGGECTECRAGTFSTDADVTKCSLCPPGQSSSVGSSTCFNCTAGQTSSSGGLCTNCTAGTSSSSGDTSCTLCNVGFKSISGGLCTPCDPGQTSSSDRKSCVPCTAGSISGEGSACTACTGNTIAAEGNTICVPCLDGTEPNAAHSSCQLISPSHSPTGSTTSSKSMSRSSTGTLSATKSASISRSASKTKGSSADPSTTKSFSPSISNTKSTTTSTSITPTVSVSRSEGTFIPSSKSPGASASRIEGSITPNPIKTASSSPSLNVDRKDTQNMEVIFDCTKERISQCCEEFIKEYVALESKVNNIQLIERGSCGEESAFQTRAVGPRIKVKFIQYGSNYHSSKKILNEYLDDGECGDTPCFPADGTLESPLWSQIVEINVVSESSAQSSGNQSSDSSSLFSSFFFVVFAFFFVVLI